MSDGDRPLRPRNSQTAGLNWLLIILLILAAAYGFTHVFSGRGALMNIGALVGTIMAANVWMRIWPNQRRIIGAIKEGKAPDAAWAALAGLRSKHNTYMSIPLIFFMMSNHFVGQSPILGDVGGRSGDDDEIKTRNHIDELAAESPGVERLLSRDFTNPPAVPVQLLAEVRSPARDP